MIEYPSDGRRVSIEKNSADFVQSLTPAEGEVGTAPFATVADLVAFAAAYGASHSDPLPVKDKASKPSPIRYDTFAHRNYGSLIDLLAAYKRKDVRTLTASEENLNERLEIFEGYANAGVQQLKEKLDPFADKLEGLELLLASGKTTSDSEAEMQDLSDLL
jgi:dnd system-associated protein 4